MMAQTLLEVKVSLNELFNIDSLLATRVTSMQDLISAPASQTFLERIFSVNGLLTEGCRNRMTKSLEMRVFLRLNAHIISGMMTLCAVVDRTLVGLLTDC